MKLQKVFALWPSACCRFPPLHRVESQEKLTVAATTIARGDIDIVEPLITPDHYKLDPGRYRVAIAMNSLREGIFVLSLFKIDLPGSESDLSKNAINTPTRNSPEFYIGANILNNSLVKGIASNIKGTFGLKNVTPSESVLTFKSAEFTASSVMLGRAAGVTLPDLSPVSITMERPQECGKDCRESYVKVILKNDGKSAAKGKWNVILLDPGFYVGSISNVQPGTEAAVVSSTRIKLRCCTSIALDVEVHADFFNHEGIDSNESNNTKRFAVKLQ